MKRYEFKPFPIDENAKSIEDLPENVLKKLSRLDKSELAIYRL